MTRVIVPDLVPATAYKVQVRAVSDGEFSEWSESFTFTTSQNATLPAAPATVTWTVQGDGFFATWTEVTQDISGGAAVIDSYELELTASSVTKVVVVPAQKGQSGNWSLDFQGNIALFGTAQPSISLRVRAVNNKGIKGNWSGSINATNAVPANVSGFTGTAITDGVTLTWTANTDPDLDRYEVFVGTTSGFTPSSGNRIFAGNSTSYFYSSTTYSAQYFKIRAIDKFGQPSATDALAGPYTPISPFGADTTAPATPTGLTATITTTPNAALTTTAAVSWTANSESDLAGYFLRYRINGTTPWNTVRYDKTTTSTVISNLTPYVNYDFQLAAVDWSENMSSYTSTATGTGATNVAPSTPTAPTVSTNTMQAQVTVPGTKAAGGSMEADVSYYEVYGSTTTGFTPAAASQLGVIPVGPAMVATFQIPTTGGLSTQTWFFKIIAVDNGGLKSSASAQTSGTPGLIDTTNIVNLAVTNAKINDLAVDKLTAGSGIINNLTVKSVLTMGDASTTGTIQSFDYSSGTAGFKLTSVSGVGSLEINNGSISAAALRIQAGANQFNPQYATFGANTFSYPSPFPVNNSGSFTVALSSAQTRYSANSLLLTNTSGAARTVFFGQSSTDYNFPVDPSTTYIISLYTYNSTAPTAPAIFVSLKDQTGSSTNSGLGSLSTTTGWSRSSFQITTGSSAQRAILSFTLNNTSTAYIDGIQVEPKTSTATSSPSPWAPPAATTISGGLITTGSIRSTGTATVVKTEPIYDAQGNLLYYGNPTTVTDPDGRPAWNISTTGSAEFSNLLVSGNTVLGPPTTVNTTVGKSLTVNTANTSPTLVGFPGAFQLTDVGLSITGTNIPGGTTIIGYVNSQTVTMSANATANGTAVSATIFRPAHYVSQIASSNFLQGTTGWMVRSDGYAEFRQLAADSIDGGAIRAATIDVNRLKAGTMTAAVALAGSITAANSTTITLATTAASASVTSSDANFTAADVGLRIVGANIPDGTTISAYTSSTAVTLSKTAITTGTDPTALLFRGRQVTMDSTGINLIGVDGKPIISLPTSDDAAQFNGKVNSSALSVEDYLQMTGTHNAILPDSSLNLTTGTYVPSSPPTVTFSWPSNILTDTDGSAWVPTNITNFNRGFYYDPTDGVYVYVGTDDSGTMGIYRFSTSTFALVGAAFVSGSLVSYGTALSVTSDSSNYYLLFRDENSGAIKLGTISRSQITNGVISGFTTTSTWTDPTGWAVSDYPSISLYAGNIYLAFAYYKTGGLTLEKYTGITVATASKAFTTSFGNIGHNNQVTGIQVGKFDLGGTNVYMALSTSVKVNGVSIYQVGGSSFSATTLGFSMPNGTSQPPGTTWVAATVDTSSGHFETLGNGGTVYMYTGLGATTNPAKIWVRQYWRNTTTPAGGGISSASQVLPTTFVKRSTVNFKSATAIPNIGGNSPDAVAFAASVTSSSTGFWRYAEPSAGVDNASYTTVLTADAAGITTGSMLTGAPATFTNGSGFTISGAGSIKWGSSSRAVADFDFDNNGGGTTNGSSQVVTSHGLGVTPRAVLVTTTGASGQMIRVVAKSSTTFTTEHRTTAGALTGTGVTVAYDWVALA